MLLASVALFDAATPLLVALLLAWGAVGIADSAQFSTAITEVADPRYGGSR